MLVNHGLKDWEHNMVRFQNGTPTQVWFSQHGFGEAFTCELSYPSQFFPRCTAFELRDLYQELKTPGTCFMSQI